MTKQEAYDQTMTAEKRVERFERYSETVESLQYQLSKDFNFPPYNDKDYYDEDDFRAKEIFDMLSKILDEINCFIWDVKQETAA